MTDGGEATRTNRRDVTLALSAVSAIFAALVGTNVLDIDNSARPMVLIDHATIVLWLPALLLLAVCAYKAPSPARWQLRGAWGATLLAGVVTAGVLLFTGFGFTRDKDHVRLLLTRDAATRVRELCGREVDNGGFYGTIRTQTLQQEFVIADLARRSEKPCSVDIARSEVHEIREHPVQH